MTVRYLSEDYVYGALGANLTRALLNEPGLSLPLIIQQASGLVRSLLLAKSYAAPETTDPATVTDVVLQLATMAAVRQMLYSIASNSVPFPSEWTSHPEYVALIGLSNGKVQPDLTSSTLSAPGGWGFATARDTSTASNWYGGDKLSPCKLRGL